MSSEPSGQPSGVWPVMNALIGTLEENYISGEKSARILAPVMADAAIRLGYDLDMVQRAYAHQPWTVEAARRAAMSIDQWKPATQEEESDAAGISTDRGAGADSGGALPELGAVRGPSAPRPARGRRPGARPGAGESAG